MKIQLIILALLFTTITSKNWLVLIAGTYSWDDYKDQANVFHLYKLSQKFKVPKENIIVFAMDDLAHNSRNPIQGKVFNSQYGGDVYAGHYITYYGEDIDAQNVASVLFGDEDSIIVTDERSERKVLKSNQDDNVFVYYSGYGERQLIYLCDDFLKAEELFKIMEEMVEQKMFKNLVFYLDALEGLSMFEPYSNFMRENRIYALTGTQTYEEEWAKICDNKVEGIDFGVCLNTEFSIDVFNDIEKRGEDLKNETIDQQFWNIDEIMKWTRAHRWGDDVNISKKMSLYDFISGGSSKRKNLRWFKK